MIFKQASVVVIWQGIFIPKQFEVYNSIVRKMIHVHAIFPGVDVSGNLHQDHHQKTVALQLMSVSMLNVQVHDNTIRKKLVWNGF